VRFHPSNLAETGPIMPTAMPATQTLLPRTDYAVRLFAPLAESRLDFVGVRQAITADLEAEADRAYRGDDAWRAGALGRFAREQAARPTGPGSWEAIMADVEYARSLVEGASPIEGSASDEGSTGAASRETGPVVAQGSVVDLYVCMRDPGVRFGAGDVGDVPSPMVFLEPVRVSRDAWYDALDAARARAGGKTTPAPTVLFACGTLRKCEGATDLVPIEGEPGRFDRAARTKLIPV
jgi:hypothetical protein